MVLTFSGALNAVYADSATWSLNPISKDWNTAANWMPPTVPNGSADTATFGVSNVLDPRLRFRHEAVEVNGIVFTPDASAFTIVLNHASLLITGSGVSNNSGVVQNFFAGAGAVNFYGTASAGSLTVYTNGGGTQSDVPGGVVNFSDDATADDATFINLRPNGGLFGGETVFFDNSSIGNATVINDGGADTTVFSAAVGGNPTIVNNASMVAEDDGGSTLFYGGGPGNGTVTCNGSALPETHSSGAVHFNVHSTAGNATLIANGRVAGGVGGLIQFTGSSMGATSRVEVFGNGTLDISEHDLPNVRVGSLEGDGLVFLGPVKLVVGSNGLSTTFSGVIEDTGELTKLGNGTLTLSGANTYTGGTTVSDGVLLVSNRSGSGTGTGAVQVDAGTLGGRGIISGAVTVGTGSGTGAFLSPSEEALKQLTLTIQSALTFKADGTYTYRLNTRKTKADKIIADGVTIEAGATFAFVGIGNRALTPGTVFTAISNTSANPISGTFSNLADGSVFTANGNNFEASYEGGDGNDLTLTVVP